MSVAAHVPSAPLTTTIHSRRTGSQAKNDLRASGPSVIYLFVKNVRLLNLDLLPDWPVLTPATLSNQDARARIRGTEWCLYQLFKVYDPATTTDKLQPFFPPLEPLQSINLRAALYRCLNELKKNGILARETVLRKSMLDECQGEKFWELCLNFSSIVLRKVHIEKRNALGGIGQPIAERMGTAQNLNKRKRESLLPLSVVHRAALTKVLQEKERKRDTFARLHDVLVEKDTDLQRRKTRVIAQQKKQAQDKSGEGRSEKVKIAQDVLEKQWVGSNELQAALIYGGETTGGDFLLKTSFDDIWEANGRGQLASMSVAEAGILEDLDSRTRQQRRRLERWQNFHDKLVEGKPAVSKPPATNRKSTATVPKRDMPLCFDRHQTLSVHDMEDLPQSPAQRLPRERLMVLSKYDEILTAMREELRRNVPPGQALPRDAIKESRRLSVRPGAASAASIDSTGSESQSRTVGGTPAHRRNPSQTAVPMRPSLMGRRVSSRSRSYNQPKVISQRELVPLKSELFSPLKGGGKRMSVVSTASGSLASPVEGDVEGGFEDRKDGQLPNPHDSGVVFALSGPSSVTGSRASSNASGASSPSAGLEVPRGEDAHSPLMNHRMRPSLAERTRMSMAHTGPDHDTDTTATFSHGNQLTQEPESIHDETDTVDALPTTQRPISLMERTRQSISMAPPAPTPLRIMKNHRSRTSIFPVNQFETPPAKRRTSAHFDLRNLTHEHEHETSPTSILGSQPRVQQDAVAPLPTVTPAAAKVVRRDFTPREKLFAADAEYDSVFKTRPKVALSPIISPRDSGHATMENDDEDGDGDFDLENHDLHADLTGRSSPLVR